MSSIITIFIILTIIVIIIFILYSNLTKKSVVEREVQPILINSEYNWKLKNLHKKKAKFKICNKTTNYSFLQF